MEQLGGAKGRGVVARRAFKPGDLALEDRALAYAVIGSSAGSVCDCCLAPSSGPLRCDLQGLQQFIQIGHNANCVTMRTPASQSLSCGCSRRRRHWPTPPIAAPLQLPGAVFCACQKASPPSCTCKPQMLGLQAGLLQVQRAPGTGLAGGAP